MVGACVFLCTMLNPNIGISGLLAVIASYSIARLIRMDHTLFQPGFYTYNPLLIGLSLGSVLQLSWLSAFFCVVAATLTLFLTIGMFHIFRHFLNLPVLSLPFAAASVITYLASLRYSNLVIQTPVASEFLQSDFGLPLAIIGFCKSLGSIFLMPYVSIGVLLAVMLLASSRILFTLATLGYLVGALVRSAMLGSTHQAFSDVSSFNFILIAMALGGVFLTPSLLSYTIALLSVAASTVVTDAFSVFGAQFGMPVYTLPFNIVTLGVLYALGLNSFPKLAKQISVTPEQTLENDVVNQLRYPGSIRTLSLPFFGTWRVWQGFDGEWTHKGNWQHAYDFLITGDDGENFRGLGLKLEDYYCWRKPVVSPTRGRVTHVVNHLPDNPIGHIDKTNNWGNCVVIYDDRGYYVELSHFAEGSIRVKPGDWVEPGQSLGICGNSGYSPQPHLHIHVQATADIGSKTLPFSFVGFIVENHYFSNDLPHPGTELQPAPTVDASLDAITEFLLDDRLSYRVFRNGLEIDRVQWQVSMAVDGTMCLKSDRGCLFFGKHAGTFYIYRVDGADRYLRALWTALPRMPLNFRERLRWNDFVPLSLVVGGFRQSMIGWAASVVSELAVARTRSSFVSQTRIETQIEGLRFKKIRSHASVEWDAERGFKTIELGDLVLRRHEYVSAATS